MTRATSIDAYRGFVMLLMLAEVLHLPRVAAQFRGDPIWEAVLFHTTHVEWRGCSLHDLIQPSFSFLVGAALAFSMAKRKAEGQSFSRAALHAGWRAFALIALGIVLRSVGKTQTNFTFEDTLTQIGLGYFPLFLLAWARRGSTAWHWVTISLLVVSYWAAFALFPTNLPHCVREPSEWPHHLTGFESHWEKNDNLAWCIDHTLLNLLPRESKFVANRGGYATLSYFPTLATMLLGLLAGGMLREPGSARVKLGVLGGIGAGLLAAGWAFDTLGVCPMVKRIWTPSWVLYSGGWCFLLLAFFHASTDALGYRGWSYPLRVIGANSILIYCVAEVPITGFIVGTFKTHFGANAFQFFGPRAEPVVAGAAVLAVYWLGLWWMYTKKVFVRI